MCVHSTIYTLHARHFPLSTPLLETFSRIYCFEVYGFCVETEFRFLQNSPTLLYVKRGHSLYQEKKNSFWKSTRMYLE